MDIKRIWRAYRAAMRLGLETPVVVAMPEQLDTLIQLFAPMGKIEFFQILKEPLMAAFGLTLYEPSTEQYRTAKGALFYATDIPIRQKAGRPPAKKMEPSA